MLDPIVFARDPHSFVIQNVFFFWMKIITTVISRFWGPFYLDIFLPQREVRISRIYIDLAKGV